MMTPMWNRWPIAAALALTIVLPAGHVAHAQSLVIRDSALAVAIQDGTLRADQSPSTPPSKACNRKRRAVIGAIIGGAAAYPLAWFAYHRSANESVEGSPMAGAVFILGAAGATGALIGRGSCK